MIQEAYVSFETAKLLKKKGFNEPCDHFYRFDKPKTIYTGTSYRNSEIGDKQSKVYNTCTQQMAMRWLREVHNLIIEVRVKHHFRIFDGYYTGIVHLDGDIHYEYTPNEYLTYEEACEAAIKYCLEHLI